MLQIQHICKEYRTANLVQKALDDVSLNLRDNEFVAILGPSGSGKTTLLNIIGGLDRYDSGDLVINGISTKKYKDRDWDSYRNHTIGFVFQSYNLIPHQTVLSNVELALTISGIGKEERRKRAIEALEQVGLGEQLHKKPNQMSGGQMQRVAIARALVNDPDILLADEPTGALDSETSVQVMDLLREVAKDRLVVMVTHNPELAQDYATRIVKLKDGKIRSDSDVLLVAGIGGSYLGARAVVEAVKGLYHNEADDGLKIYFCGNTISPTALNDIIKLTKGKRFSINVISKSGTTTETALAFRVLRKLLEDSVGAEEANKRIYATTDRAKGTLKQLATEQGWPTFVVPDDVGGRYSVLTAVGLLPIACAGIDIDELMQGAVDGREKFGKLSPDNDAYRYAMTRNILYRKGKSVETLACFEPDFTMMNEWYKQLFGESEGKDQKGLMPTSCIFSTDLHSMGQFLQDGARIMFETYVDVKHTRDDFYIEELEGNFDGLNFLANQNMSVVNRKAMEGTILAHTDGGVPLGLIEVDSLSAHDVGELIYFFWRACAVSGYLLSVNPFDQPGVESYKKNMFALLGKPGYEDRKAELEAALKD